MATLVALCQQTWTLELDLWPEGRESKVRDTSDISELSPSSEPEQEGRYEELTCHTLMSSHHLPLMDFKLRYLFDGVSIPRSLAN